MSSTQILGVPFFTGSLDAAADRALAGGSLNAPSGPGMAYDLTTSASYRRALLEADMNITDSGVMVLAWRLRTGQRIPRYSGLLFLRTLMARPEFREPGAVFWIMPSREEADRNRDWLNANGYPVTEEDIYLAPHYGKGELRDQELISRLETRRPKVVMLAIGGGTQERLAHALRGALSYRPALLCLGAAIAFITGGQAAIPGWADRLYLGWFLRILYSPRRYFPRYWQALSIFFLIARHRDRLPPMKTS